MNRYNLLLQIRFLLPKCKYAVEHGSNEYIKKRFLQLITLTETLIEEVKQ